MLKTFHPISSLIPTLPAPGEPMVRIKLTDVDIVGVVSIQIIGPGLSQLQLLTKEIEERHSKKCFFVQKLVVGSTYCAKYSVDQTWYRVKVKSELPPKKVLVEYIDYGNEEVVDRMKLRTALDSELFSLPQQAVKCVLEGLPPPKGQWTESAMEYLSEYIYCEELNLEVVDYRRIHGPASPPTTLPVIRLHMKSESDEMICINQSLQQLPHIFGLEAGRDARRVHSTSSASSLISSESVGAGNPPGNFVPQTQAAFSIGDGENGADEQEEDEGRGASERAQQSGSLHRNRREAFVVEGSSQASGAESSEVEVEVTWIQSPHCFTLILAAKRVELERLVEDLNSCIMAEPSLPHGALHPGLLCAARYSVDRMWYRATVTDISSSDVTVEFVDYGGVSRTLCSGLKCLPERFHCLPLQGIKASLYGIRPVGESWSEGSRSSFKDMVMGKTLFALEKGRQDSGPTSVILLDTTTSSQIDKVIHFELVNLNHAAKTEH